ncbi:MAG: hypothetical protein QM655_16180 [Nocardioidaceae bacterium]
MVADIRGVPNRYVLELGGVDCSDQTTSCTLGKASQSAQTFAEYRTGGPFSLKIAAIQNFATGSIWDLAVNHPGSGVTGAFYPLGNATGSSLPKFSVTATVSAPTSDEHVGGEGGAVDADSPTFETEWLLVGKWAQSTVT